MKVSSSAKTKRYIPTRGRAKIDFAIRSVGGNSSAGEKHNFKEKAVRLSWWNAKGKYDPISSAELPAWAIMDVIEACADIDFLAPEDAALLIKALAESIRRQCHPAIAARGSSSQTSARQVRKQL
jgi:hypothetical protein